MYIQLYNYVTFFLEFFSNYNHNGSPLQIYSPKIILWRKQVSNTLKTKEIMISTKTQKYKKVK